MGSACKRIGRKHGGSLCTDHFRLERNEIADPPRVQHFSCSLAPSLVPTPSKEMARVRLPQILRFRSPCLAEKHHIQRAVASSSKRTLFYPWMIRPYSSFPGRRQAQDSDHLVPPFRTRRPLRMTTMQHFGARHAPKLTTAPHLGAPDPQARRPCNMLAPPTPELTTVQHFGAPTPLSPS